MLRPSRIAVGGVLAQYDVEPGTYSLDSERGAASFHRLREFEKAHPQVEIRVGHQR